MAVGINSNKSGNRKANVIKIAGVRVCSNSNDRYNSKSAGFRTLTN